MPPVSLAVCRTAKFRISELSDQEIAGLVSVRLPNSYEAIGTAEIGGKEYLLVRSSEMPAYRVLKTDGSILCRVDGKRVRKLVRSNAAEHQKKDQSAKEDLHRRIQEIATIAGDGNASAGIRLALVSFAQTDTYKTMKARWLEQHAKDNQNND